jgi:hypothetical protein
MKIITALLLAGMMSMSGCATKALTDKLPQIQGNDFSTVYIVRERRIVLGEVAFTIQFNGKDLVRIQNGECLGFKIPTGQSEIALSSTSHLRETPVIKGIKFMAERGKEYYFYVRAEAGASGSEFRELSHDKWLERYKNCDWTILEKQ